MKHKLLNAFGFLLLSHVIYCSEDSSLLDAAQRGKVKECHELLMKKASVSVTNDQGKTPLHLAVYKGCIDTCQLLLEQGSSVILKDNEHQTALHIACKMSHAQLCEILAQKDANSVTTYNQHGETPLHVAARFADSMVCQILLDTHVECDVTDLRKGNTPLHIAALREHFGICRVLIQAGAKTTLKNQQGRTPLDCTLEKKNFEIATLLLNSMEDYNNSWFNYAIRSKNALLCSQLFNEPFNEDIIGRSRYGLTPLHMACAFGNLTKYADYTRSIACGRKPFPSYELSDDEQDILKEITATLLSSPGVNVDERDSFGRTPLHIACEWGREIPVFLLLEAQADPQATLHHPNYEEIALSPLDVAILADHTPVAKLLLQWSSQHPEKSKVDVHFEQLLVFGVLQGDVSLVEFLLKHKSKRGKIDESDTCLLHLAAYAGQIDLCQLFITVGMQIDKPLDQAEAYENVLPFLKMTGDLSLLSKKQVDSYELFQTKHRGEAYMPLHCAAESRNEDVCRLFLAKGAPCEAENSSGKTPLDCAVQQKNSTISFFLERGANIRLSTLEVVEGHATKLLSDTIKERHTASKNILSLREYGTKKYGQMDESGMTLLHRVAVEGDAEKFRHLLPLIGTLSKRDNQGRTPLHLACQSGEDKRRLQLNGPNRIAFLLLNDPLMNSHILNAQDTLGYTALHYACMGGKYSHVLVKELLEKGADPDCVSKSSQKTPRMIAQESLSQELIALFE